MWDGRPLQKKGSESLTRESESLVVSYTPPKESSQLQPKNIAPTTKLYIKNMVSLRCKLIVKDELEKLGIHYGAVNLGEILLQRHLTQNLHDTLNTDLKRWGLEIIDSKKAILIERIKNVVIETIHYSEEALRINFSDYLSEKLKHDYTYLANLFSEVTGSTIQHFIITHKIERVKELLLYHELNLTEIAYKLHYSSVGHLSNQFKKITGLTPSFFIKLKHKKLKNLESIK